MNVLDMFKNGKSDYVPLEEQKSSLVSGGDISQLNPETIKNLEQNQKKLNKPVVNNQENDEWYMKNFGKPDNGGEIKTYNNDDLKEKLEKANYSNQHKTILETNNSSPVQELLNKMRYSKSVSLKITFNEMIPKLEDIKSMQKIFDELPIVETIAEKIANKYFQDKELFVNMIIGELEKLMKKPIKKPINKNVSK
jgi:hypothetical protein